MDVEEDVLVLDDDDSHDGLAVMEGKEDEGSPAHRGGDSEVEEEADGEESEKKLPVVVGTVSPRHASPVGSSDGDAATVSEARTSTQTKDGNDGAGDDEQRAGGGGGGGDGSQAKRRASVFNRLGGVAPAVGRAHVTQRLSTGDGEQDKTTQQAPPSESSQQAQQQQQQRASKRAKRLATEPGRVRAPRIFASAIDTIKQTQPIGAVSGAARSRVSVEGGSEDDDAHKHMSRSSRRPPVQQSTTQHPKARPFEMIPLPDIADEIPFGNGITLEKRHFVRVNASGNPSCFNDVSYWDIQERLAPAISAIMPPETTLQPLRDLSTAEMLVLWLHCPASTATEQLVQSLNGRVLKFMGVVHPITITAEVLLHHPRQPPADLSHSWFTSHFRHHYDDTPRGQRPDTVYVTHLPVRWFARSRDQLSEGDVAQRFAVFGHVHRVALIRSEKDLQVDAQVLRSARENETDVSHGLDIVSTGYHGRNNGDYNNDSNSSSGGGAVIPSPRDLHFDAFVQFEQFESALACARALNERCLSRVRNGRHFQVFATAAIDTSSFLSDAQIRKRRWRAEEIKRATEEEEERKRKEEEERRRREEEEERERQRQWEEEQRREEERRQEKEERRREKKRRKERKRREREERERRKREEEERRREEERQRQEEEQRRLEEEKRKQEEEEQMKRQLMEQKRQKLLEEQRKLIEEEERLLRQEEERLRRLAAIEHTRQQRQAEEKEAREREAKMKLLLMKKKRQQQQQKDTGKEGRNAKKRSE
ncbi:hypothetical protein PTSG_04726 [Salpingoeca rosetta]|uniref:RRM domain-containing protein n=1 Tax=Salpingoeca rosetta (strain ATCC 50818 / BSB-021) TaxID=946362 RepID=F2U9J0_SALR5|nr:uncharacterized protein PTSG_04726 [Salpingoeca rosetta]EGD73017.1 hypothetical protein PTSG_04726 [Salpingoeca rosetta]|eukprot:XP_004994048.1 hypothetical protein PTSG_04726 [Salpingoeca rosetta]